MQCNPVTHIIIVWNILSAAQLSASLRLTLLHIPLTHLHASLVTVYYLFICCMPSTFFFTWLLIIIFCLFVYIILLFYPGLRSRCKNDTTRQLFMNMDPAL